MNEREAIQFEMQELKEQGRLDFEMYFELRKHRNQRYNELLNRLRELDERDHRLNTVAESYMRVSEERLQRPRNEHMSIEEIKLDRYKGDSESVIKMDKSKVSYDKIIEVIEEYLKTNGKSPMKEIKEHVEKTLHVKWVNFNNVLKIAIKKSNNIEKHKLGKRFIYSYKGEE